jgi:hypothetical protein
MQKKYCNNWWGDGHSCCFTCPYFQKLSEHKKGDKTMEVICMAYKYAVLEIINSKGL